MAEAGETNTTRPCAVLVIDDEPDIRSCLQEALEWEGHRVITAANGREGLEVLPDIQDLCLILLDLMMPDMNGWEFAAAMRADPTLASIPIVFVSALNEPMSNVPATALVKKPVDLDALLSLVRHHCHVLGGPAAEPPLGGP